MGVPINSLQDLLLLQEIHNRADPFRSGLNALAEGVAVGIEEARQRKLEQRKIAEQNAQALEMYKRLNNSTSGKAQTLIPSLKINKTGGLEMTARTPTITEEKTLTEEERFQRIQNRIEAFRSGQINEQEFMSTPNLTETDIKTGLLKRQLGGTAIPQGDNISIVEIDEATGKTRVIPGRKRDEGVEQFIERPEDRMPDNIYGYEFVTPSLQFKKDMEIWTNWKKEETKSKMTLSRNFGAMKGLNQMLISTWKAAAKEKADKDIPKGLISKIMAGTADVLELEGYPHTKAYIGARIEYAMNASKIITGGSRIVRDVFKNILRTLPEDTGLVDDAYAKLRQSFHSALARSTERDFSNDELNFIDNDFYTLWNDTPMAQLPKDLSIEPNIAVKGPVGTRNYRIPDGRVLYNVPAYDVPRLLEEFGEIWEVE